MPRRKPLPPVRNTYTGVAGTSFHCQTCGWETYERNGLGIANQHARRTGHHVSGEQIIVVSYNRPD